MKKIFLIIILLLSLSGFLCAKDTLRWIETFSEAIEKSKSEDKILMLNFFSNRYRWCKKLQDNTFKDSIVIEFLNENFISSKINTSLNENKNIYKMYKVSAYPTTIFINPVPADVWTIEIDRIIGYLAPEDFIRKAKLILNNRHYFQTLVQQSKLYPDSIEIHIELAEIYKRRADYVSAEEIYNNVLKMLEKSNIKDSFQIKAPAIKEEIAMLSYIQKNYEDALRQLMALEKEFPDYPELDEILFSQALCVYKLKQPLKAKKILRKIITDFPQSSFKEHSKRFLEYLTTQIEENNL